MGLKALSAGTGTHTVLRVANDVLMAQLKQELGIDLPVASLYERLTIRALAELLDPRREEAAAERDSAEFEEKERRASWRKQYQQSRRDRKQSAS